MFVGACGMRASFMGRQRKQLEKVVAYMRTSSATNVGADKDSETRQRVARLLSPPGPP